MLRNVLKKLALSAREILRKDEPVAEQLAAYLVTESVPMPPPPSHVRSRA